MRKLKIVLVISLLILTNLRADDLRYVFIKDHFEKDLTYDQVEDILIDQDGFIWIATTTGLHKYDGYDFETFISNPRDKTSISENFVTTIEQEDDRHIWIGTYNHGLNLYDITCASFKQFQHDPTNDSTISSNRIPRNIRATAHDNAGGLWLNTEGGLDRIDITSGKVERHGIIEFGHILFDDTKDCIWMGGDELVKYDPNTKEKHRYSAPAAFDKVNDFYQGEDQKIWLATNKGVYLFDISLERFIDLKSLLSIEGELATTLFSESITVMHQDMNGRYWLGIDKKIYVLDMRSGDVTVLGYQEGQQGILNQRIKGIYGDKKGQILVTYEKREVTRINTRVKKFHNISTNLDQDKGIRGENIRSIYKDQKGTFWIGTYNYGLNRLDASGAETIYSYDEKDPQSLSATFITSSFVDSHDRLWVGTFEDGFCYSDEVSKHRNLKFERFDHKDNLETHGFFERQDEVWISTNRGFYVYSYLDDAFRKYGYKAGEDSAVQKLNIQSVIDLGDELLLATWNKGVVKLDPKSHKMKVFDVLEDIHGSPIDHRFINILQSKDGTIWLASPVNGLVKMTEKESKSSFEAFDKSRGAPSNTVYSILEDDNGLIWVSTSEGIGRFDTATEQFINYHQSDGLQTDSFIWDSNFEDADGTIYFGGLNGLTYFHPDSISTDAFFPKPYLHSLIVNHLPIGIGDTINGRAILDSHLRFKDEITLTNEDGSFSIEFAALGVSDVDRLVYSYRLEGFNDDWVNTSSDRRIATYTNLKPGKYEFKVRVGKAIGQWSEHEASVMIKILPPWWTTWWAYAMYVVIILVLIYLFQTELIKRSYLSHQLELEQYKRERDNELNQEKFKFFTNLSHELRTPLTLILGPLGRMINKQEVSTRVNQNLLLIQKQALRLQKLTNQLMDFRKYEIHNLKLRSADGDIIKFIDEIRVAFRQHAEVKGIKFYIKSDLPKCDLYFDRDKLEIVFANFLSNAFKFTSKDGEVKIDLQQKPLQEVKSLIKASKKRSVSFGDIDKTIKHWLQISISDTGVGISEKQMEHIFDRYFQASNIQSISVGGTGIGLEIAKNYIVLHHGAIMAKSEVGKGTSFTFWLPLGAKHLSKDEVLSNFKPSEHQDHYDTSSSAEIKSYAEILNDEPDESKAADKSASVLIVDDNPDILFFLKQNFENSFEVFTAQNGRIALEVAQTHIPDVVVSDIMMPEVDGLELCKAMKEDQRTSHIPVILLTARTANIFQIEGLETGADDYMSKPFDEKVLYIKVKNLIDSRKHLRQRYAQDVVIEEVTESLNKPDEEFLNKITSIIEGRISDGNMKVEDIAREIGMSHSVLYKKVQAITDLSVIEFIRTVRLKKAAKVLKESAGTVVSVSSQVGFSDAKYFSKSFQKFFGCTPSEYKKKFKS